MYRTLQKTPTPHFGRRGSLHQLGLLSFHQWSKGPKTERAGTAAEVVQAVAEELEAQFEQIRANAAKLSQPAKTP